MTRTLQHTWGGGDMAVADVPMLVSLSHALFQLAADSQQLSKLAMMQNDVRKSHCRQLKAFNFFEALGFHLLALFWTLY